jgi:hypothetical protein
MDKTVFAWHYKYLIRQWHYRKTTAFACALMRACHSKDDLVIWLQKFADIVNRKYKQQGAI